jgi:hypothetical protein
MANYRTLCWSDTNQRNECWNCGFVTGGNPIKYNVYDCPQCKEIALREEQNKLIKAQADQAESEARRAESEARLAESDARRIARAERYASLGQSNTSSGDDGGSIFKMAFIVFALSYLVASLLPTSKYQFLCGWVGVVLIFVPGQFFECFQLSRGNKQMVGAIAGFGVLATIGVFLS